MHTIQFPGNHKRLMLALFMAFGAATSQAAISACATSPTGTAISSYAPSALGTGCSSLDISFENIALQAGATGTQGFVAATTSNTAIYATGSDPTTGSTLFINPTVGGNWDATSANNLNGSMAFTLNYVAIANSTGGIYTAPPAGQSWFLDTLTPTIAGTVNAQNGGTQQARVVTTFCLGATTTTGCTAANSGTITATIAEGTSISYSCSTTTVNYSCGTGGVISILSHVTQVAFSSAFTANHLNSGSTVDLNSYALQVSSFSDIPEPGTFGMLGSALVGLGLVARRKKKA